MSKFLSLSIKFDTNLFIKVTNIHDLCTQVENEKFDFMVVYETFTEHLTVQISQLNITDILYLVVLFKILVRIVMLGVKMDFICNVIIICNKIKFKL
jgi:hypothetical protein